SLRTDERVAVHERTNVRELVPEAIGGPVGLVVADLSFISLRLVLPALTRCALPGADLLPMVKPQFEVGRDRLGAGGVVRAPALRCAASAPRRPTGRRSCSSSAATGPSSGPPSWPAPPTRRSPG